MFSSGGDLNCTEDDNRTTYRGAAGNKNAGLIYGGYKDSNFVLVHRRLLMELLGQKKMI